MTPSPGVDLADRAARALTIYSGWVICAIIMITGLLLLPTFLMRPTEQASRDPGGPVFDLQELVNERFPTRVHIASFIAEDRDGDILRQAPLWELYRNEQELRSSDLGDFLFSGYDVDTQRRIRGIFTLADAIQDLFRLDRSRSVTLETATDQQVKEAVSRILASPTGRLMRASLSKDAHSTESVVEGRKVEEWRAAALSVFVAGDNAGLGGGPLTISLTDDEATLGKERFNRRVQRTLRGREESFRLWGIALDVNLTSREQGRTVVPYIAATLALVLVVVGVTLRSVKGVALGFVGFLILLVWLKGFSNLIGLKSSLTSDLIVPIAMISLGADFLIHAVARYREEGRGTTVPSRALRAGLAGVLGALTLATLSDGIAFLANVTSGIETIIGFGVAAGIAVLSSYVIMGILLPLVIMRLDERKRVRTVPDYNPQSSGPVQPPEDGTDVARPPRDETSISRVGIAWLVVKLAEYRWVVLPVTALVTAGATFLSFQLDPKLDIKDFFDSGSDFIVGLDKLDEHTDSALAGEPAVLYIEGDLAATESLNGIRSLLRRLGDNPNLGHSEDGSVFLYSRTVFDLLRRVTGSGYARQRVFEDTGVVIADSNGDGIPDTPEQTRAAYVYMAANGVPLDEHSTAYDPLQVREVLYVPGETGGTHATIIVLGVLGSREQANLGPARKALEQDLGPLMDLPSVSSVGVTGSPFAREATLTSTTRALIKSLPVAVVACFILLTLWMRSVRYALVTIIPIGLVVSWLYGFMYLAGYNLNFVTATIAAVSIGVGIDYSIHMTQRFRQELAKRGVAAHALRAAASGTGVALAGSAASSIIGFAVLGFAPMPLFATYGVISAVMIFMAAVAALVVLPSLLVIVARPSPEPGPAGS